MLVDVRPDKMIHGGLTLARLTDGRVALIGGALPGEQVRVELAPRKGVLMGQVTEVLEPSPDRVAAPRHPGLDYGFIRYERQLELKRDVAREALARVLGREEAVSAVVAAPSQWAYRSTVQPASVQGRLGYRQPGSHEVVMLASDPTALESLQDLWRAWPELRAPKGVREVVMRGNRAGEVLLTLVATASERSLLPFAHDLLRAGVLGVGYARHDPRGRFRSGSSKLTGARSILETYGKFSVQVTAHSFAQPNPAAASQLYLRLVELAPGGQHALDLYAGSGVIGMHLLDKYERVTALELDKSSLLRGAQDARRLGLEGLEFVRADAREVQIPSDAELVALDPPRAGLSQALRGALTASGTHSLLYVSCDVSTWARDVADFAAHGWRLKHAEPFDFYPHTHHIEMLSLLSR